jgi:hypothetical protein
MHTNVRRIITTSLLTLALLAISRPGVAQTTLYDSFSSPLIDPSKWQGGNPFSTNARETVRRLVPNPNVPGHYRLHLSQRAYSLITDNVGGGDASLNLHFTQPGNVTAVSFTLEVSRMQAVGCAGNPALAVQVAGFEGSFFNTSSLLSGLHNGAAGDVKANVGVSRVSTNSGSALYVTGNYYQCNTADCSSQTPLFSQGLGTVQPGTTNTLTLKWDQTNHQFIFQLNNNAPVVSTYSLVDSFSPSYANKYLYSYGFVPDCTTTPRPFAFVDSYFDDVYVSP